VKDRTLDRWHVVNHTCVGDQIYKVVPNHDSSTMGLINHFKNVRSRPDHTEVLIDLRIASLEDNEIHRADRTASVSLAN
jgi:hypothetical protein